MREITPLLQIRQVAHLRSTTCNLQGSEAPRKGAHKQPRPLFSMGHKFTFRDLLYSQPSQRRPFGTGCDMPAPRPETHNTVRYAYVAMKPSFLLTHFALHSRACPSGRANIFPFSSVSVFGPEDTVRRASSRNRCESSVCPQTCACAHAVL